MHHGKPSPDLRLSLRRLTVPHALSFGHSLLERGQGRSIAFGEFVEVAREWVVERPDQCAFYLAALVALDMSEPEVETNSPPAPSPN